MFDDVSKGKAPAPRPSPPVGAREKKSPAPPKAASAAASRERWKIVAAYDYKDERGKLLYQVVRMDPKDFRQRRPDGKGGWIWSLGDVRRVLYRLPEVIKEAKGGGTVYVVEGEKDADAIVLFKLCSTCNCGGAGKWLADYAKAFTGAARVVIIADKDEPGRKHAVKVAEAVSELVKDVRVIECPDVGAIKVRDAADFFAAGGSAADLKAIVEAAKPFATATAEARPVISAEKPPELPPAVYEPERGRFHVPTPAGDWMPIPESSVMVRLRRAGFRVYLKDANGVTETEHAKERIMDERNVGYAGEIAGYAPGMKLICGRRFLVTSGPKLIEGRPGAWPRSTGSGSSGPCSAGWARRIARSSRAWPRGSLGRGRRSFSRARAAWARASSSCS